MACIGCKLNTKKKKIVNKNEDESNKESIYFIWGQVALKCMAEKVVDYFFGVLLERTAKEEEKKSKSECTLYSTMSKRIK